MANRAATIRFKAKLFRPASPKGAAWAFLVLPAKASAKLPTRGMTTVDGTINSHPRGGGILRFSTKAFSSSSRASRASWYSWVSFG
jgi:hypothetical protein